MRRILSLLLLMCILLPAAASVVRAADIYEYEEVEFEMPPTEPKPSPKQLGYAAYAAELDKTVFGGALGAIYSKKSTTFRLWSPVATDVRVCIYKTGSDAEQGAQRLAASPMKYSEKNGVWYVTLSGDYKNLYYTYQVTALGQTHEVVDPYAKAVGVNGDRGMIVDLRETDPEGWSEDSFKRASFGTEAVVWEVSVRDFSASPSSGVSEANRGRFLAFTESDTTLDGAGDIPTCVAHLRRLGVNYVQINPFYDFASIDETITDNPPYNWGYDPKNYNVPEGSYSSNPYDGRVRIKECKEMIAALHDAGIGVIMDVVYNHTYFSEDSFFNHIAPYYYYRMNEDGSWSNGSGCGNDVATERRMVRRFIRDSVTYWAQEYHIDGFRFDLMGLMDVDTMNSIRASLDKLPDGNSIIMYGEAWNMPTAAPADVKLANQSNMNLLSKRIGAFNDTARDAIKGSVFNAAEKGFVQEGKSKGGVRSAIDGDAGGWASVPNQCVNYSACHDNLTLYDKLTDSVYGDKKYTLRREDLVAMNKLSAAIVLMSRGMPFLHAGEELGRTKLGDENSYISDISVNQIDWQNLTKYTSLTEYYSGLIRIRSAVKSLRHPTGTDTELTYLDTAGKGVIAYTLTGNNAPSLVVAFNGSPTDAAQVTLPAGKWVILADEIRAGLAELGTAQGTLSVAPTSAAVLMDADSYQKLQDGEEAVAYVRYVDTADSSTMLEQRAGGSIGESYSFIAPEDILFRYNIISGSEEMTGTFETSGKVITVECEAYEGGYSSVTFRFIDEKDQPISDAIVMTNRIGQQYFTPTIPGLPGYRLDLDRLPGNGAGLYTEEPIEVVYRYAAYDGSAVSPDAPYTCRANVIYISETGKILGTETLTGSEGSRIEPETRTFGGYQYLSVSDAYAAFKATETNVVVGYAEKPSSVLVYVIIAGAVVVILGAASLIVSRRSKRRKINAIEIEE